MRRPYPVIYEPQILWHAAYFYGNVPVSLEQSNGFQSISNQQRKSAVENNLFMLRCFGIGLGTVY